MLGDFIVYLKQKKNKKEAKMRNKNKGKRAMNDNKKNIWTIGGKKEKKKS